MKSIYSVHPSLAMAQAAIAKLPEKTGRSLEEWVALVKKRGPKGERERRDWLKREHGLGLNYATWLAAHAEGKGENGNPDAYLAEAERYVDGMFAGPKAALRPLYDALLDLGFSMGADVKASPCKTIVPLYRAHVFAQIKPSTRTRIDLGLALGATKTPKRLVDTGGLKKGDRITHAIPIASLSDIDADVKRWLEKAYELDA